MLIHSHRIAELSRITLHPPFGAESRELHERCECSIISIIFPFFSPVQKLVTVLFVAASIASRLVVCVQGHHSGLVAEV